MKEHDTLGLESLCLDKPEKPEKAAAPRNASRVKKRKGTGKGAQDEAPLQSELQQASIHATPSPSVLPSCQPLPISPLGSSANTLNRCPVPHCHHHHHHHHHRPFIQHSPTLPMFHPVQAPSSSNPPSVSKYHRDFTQPSTLPTRIAHPLVQPRLSSRGLGSTVQKSILSVPICP